MRRKEKQVQDLSAIESIIDKASICHLAMAVDDMPYLVPLCFGYQNQVFYFHSANEGKKLEMIRKNPRVCFQLQANESIIKADKACNWSMSYKSVIGTGIAEILTAEKAKGAALQIIMKHYEDRDWEFPAKMLEKTTVIQVAVKEMTGKQSLD